VFTAPDKATHPYAGWIPTANGRLSFRHVGDSRNPQEARRANLALNSRRLIVAQQNRPLSDALFSYVVHWIVGLEGSFWFVLAAESIGTPGDTDQLVGKVFVYKSDADWWRVEQEIDAGIVALSELANSLLVNRESEASACFDATRSRLEQTSDIEVDFSLFRNGEVYFGIPKFRDGHVRSASLQFAETTNGLDFNKWVADQSYFFLRDISHAHQHHSPSSDTLLILQVRDDDTDFGWRKRIIFALQHYIIRSKRFADATSLYQAAGILAYCNSFLQICKDATANNFDVPKFNNEALHDSLMAKAQEVSLRTTEDMAQSAMRLTRAASLRTFALTLLAIVTALIVMLVQPMIGEARYPKLRALAESLIDNFRGVISFVFLALLFIWVYTHRDWQLKTNFGRDVLEATNYARRSFAWAFVVLGVVFFILATRVGSSAVSDILSSLKDFWGALRLTAP
jgi:hypothetical protein